jgi:hypothetical protein
MATKTIEAKSPQACETPFNGPVPWLWNQTPQAGVPIRPRCQAVVTDGEREAGVKLIEQYREQEVIVAANCIESRQARLHGMKGVPAELLKREIAQCDHSKWEKAQGELAQIRKTAFVLVRPIFKRLVKSLEAELNEAALAAESRLDQAGIPIRGQAHLDRAGRPVEGEWLLHSDAICRALWSQRNIVSKTFAALVEVGDGIPAVQFLCTDEEHTPFSWL